MTGHTSRSDAIAPTASERRDRVEAGLTAALQIAGRHAETFTITERMARYAVPGVAVAVVDDGEVSWAAGYGHAWHGGPSVHATTLFQAASISKAVAAVGVLALVEAGTLDLDEDVNRRLRSWRLPDSEHTREQPVTLRHLLSHTGGTTVPGFPGYPTGESVPTAVEVLSGGGNTDAVESFAAPGTVGQYSGGGSTIVQLLVEDTTGRPFAEIMSELALRPFGMVDSTYEQPLPAARSPRAARGHDAAGAPIAGGHHVHPELQAAGLWTTAVDLARWISGVQRLLTGARSGPVSPETAALMVTPVGVGPFGLGPELGGDDTHRRFGHSGGNEGFRTWVDGLVDRPVGAAVLTNGNGGSTLCVEIRRALAAEYDWGELGGPPVEVAEVDPGVLDRYTGRYEGPHGLPMRVDRDDDGLYSPAPYGRRRLLPLTSTTFLDEETGATLEVHAVEGTVHRIAVLVEGAELMSFRRLEDAT